jgi:hypothetical protein
MSSISAGTSAGTALVSTGNTDGTLQLQVNGTTPSITLAANGSIGVGSTPGYGTSGQVLTSAGTGSAPTWSTVSAGFTLGTPVATTSGTSIDFTGIPAGTKQIIVSFNTVSTNGTSRKLIQIGDSGGIETNDYYSQSTSFLGTTVNTAAGNTGYSINSLLAAQELSGSIAFTLQNSSTNSWAAFGVLTNTSASNDSFITSGVKSLSSVLTRIRITTVNGTDAFDLGEINIAYI